MRLTAPTAVVFFLSLLLAILALIAHFGGVAIPVIGGNTFVSLLVAYVILVLGNIIRGI